MAFKPLKEDEELTRALDQLSCAAEQCARNTIAFNRARKFDMKPEGLKGFEQRVESANHHRQIVRKQILAIINDRMSSAYSAGLEDGNAQRERRG
jgi:hypothetical protein